MSRKEINVGTSPNKGDGDPLRTAFRKINENFAELYTGNFAEPDVMTSTLAPDTDGEYNLGKIDKRWTDLYVKDFIFLNGSRIELTSNGTLLINGGPPAERQDTVGSIFADDSTVMVDGIAGKVVGPVDTTTVNANTITASTFTGALIGNVTGNVTGDINGSVFADDSTLLVDANNGVIPKANVESSTNWDASFAWGNHAAAGYADGTNEANWDTAFGWGDHSAASYLTSVAFSDLTTTPTTLVGYGITDAATSAQGALAASALQAETIDLATLKTEAAAATDFADFQARIAAL